MISVADGWQHGPQRRQGRALGTGRGRRRGARAAREGPAARAGLRRAVSRAHPAPRRAIAGALARAGRVDRRDAARPASRRPTAHHVAIVDGDVRLTVDDLRARSARVAARLVERGRPARATSSRGSCRTGGKRSCSCWAIWRCGAIASPITPTLRRARGRLHPRARPARASSRCRATFRGTDYVALLRDAGFDGDGDRGARRRGSACRARDPAPAVDVDVDDPARRSCGRRARPPIRRASCTRTRRCASRPTRIAAAHEMRAGEALLLPMPVTHVAGLTYGVLLPVTCGDHRGAHGHVGAGPRARARRARSASR